MSCLSEVILGTKTRCVRESIVRLLIMMKLILFTTTGASQSGRRAFVRIKPVRLANLIDSHRLDLITGLANAKIVVKLK